jgi:putative Mg2+ transporter-C (MgtC) family protein
MELDLIDLVKLLLAMAVGGAIGAEREFHDKLAGFRTMIFICVGSTLFTILSVKLPGEHDPARIAANVVTGIGFLGAGAILRDGGRIVGLTTAATIWLVAALGMGIGVGQYAFVLLATLVVLVVLAAFPKLEHWIDNQRETRTYRVVCNLEPDRFADIEQVFRQTGLRVRAHKHQKRGEEMIGIWEAAGRPADHEIIMEKLFANPDVKELTF